MDVAYQKDTTFTDIASQLAYSSPQKNDKAVNSQQPSHKSLTPSPQLQTQSQNASQICNLNNNIPDAIIIPISDYVTSPNANNAIDISKVVDRVITSREELMKLSDSIHAPQGPSLVSLPPNDLRHRLNALHHKPNLVSC